jgi:hypothetical protein
LFETNIAPLSVQKHYRELEIIVQECILNTLRESIPVESILKAYMDETVEEDVIEEVKEQIIEEPIKKSLDTPGAIANGLPPKTSGLSFNDIDYVKTDDGSVSNVNAPKSIERLEEISQLRNELRNQQRKMEEDEDDNNAKLKISDQVFNLDSLDVHNIEEPRIELLPDLLIDDIEILE